MAPQVSPRSSSRSSSRSTPVRIVTIWCPEWPVVAAGLTPDRPAAVVHANRVVAVTDAAARAGVRPADRRRAAQGACPELEIVAHDPDRDAREFEPVVRAIAELAPRVEIVEPGTVAVVARGPSRYFGGDESLAQRLVAVVGELAPVTVGIADGRSAAAMAARLARRRPDRTLVVEPGGSPGFVADLPTGVLAQLGEVSADLVDLFVRLGLTTLGALAGLDERDVLGRFGRDGVLAHRIAIGADDRWSAATDPPPEWWAEHAFDEPVQQLDTVVFVAKRLADELVAALAAEGRVCTRLVVVVETEHGERNERAWFRLRGLSSVAMVERVRWQLEGWASQPGALTGGVALVRLVPDEVRGDDGVQSRLWGERSRADHDAARSITRLTGLAGGDAVKVPVWVGGRLPAERFRWVAAASVDADDIGGRCRPDEAPWPGALVAPSPSVVFDHVDGGRHVQDGDHLDPRHGEDRVVAEVLGPDGRAVGVSGRGELTGPPVTLAVAGRRRSIVAWAGPWPVEQRWWAPERSRRLARLQLVTDDGVGHLVALEQQRWALLATYE